MSNFEALGFHVRDRREAEGLARAPVRGARAETHLHAGRAVQVHRLEVGDGIELWTIVAGRRIVASFPSFAARRPRRGRLMRLSHPASEHLPRAWIENGAELSFHVTNGAAVSERGLTPGTMLETNLAALAGRSPRPCTGEPGLWPAPAALAAAENVYRWTGIVREIEAFDNRMTGARVHWQRVDCGAWGEIELVCGGEGEPSAPGALVEAVVTLRGAVLRVVSDTPGSEGA